ncbi:flagellar protein FlgN [Methylomarinum sp. Ch1-1]|uniref:Flagellar protein FlgN n=1 Tax=Methylomarinum roseum TaxID=3067653 RepID=A0AAU7NUM9_9GAMM|nr:flagellar protein FlgN [Methylomarinum sp. Ch1-1]MDP4519266.1 flagellar protein FlgN [Methylomarinum sp. Ch1-1]
MIEKTYPITEKLLDKGLTLSHKLFELLSQESQNLQSRSALQSLPILANSKKETVAQLEQFSNQLSQVMATEQLTLSPADIQKYFQIAHSAGLPVADGVKHWRQITEMGKKCQRLNEQNGASIDLLMRHNHRSLQILTGKSQLPATYGPDGSTRTERFSQSLVSV